ncbi:MAG: hypothetical protein LQ349_005252 [Xanthoria aureola]|nr:MAG: hypothetical protein LQ349_005252 [Xanthoria aureola]
MSDSLSQPHAAYIEDYNEDAHTTLPETRQTANVAAKRSKPDISRIKVIAMARDEASDSGYSSHTAATLTSGDSSLVSKAGSATLTLDTSVESLAAGKKKPTMAEKQSQSIPQSPQKQSRPRAASKPRPKETLQQPPCACSDCLPKGKAKEDRSAPSAQSSPMKESKQVRPQSRPTTTANAPAPKDPESSAQRSISNAAVVQPAQPRPRNPGTSSYRATPRPVSFHGGIMTQPTFYPSTHPGRSPSAYAVQSPFPPPSYPPPTVSYFNLPYQHPPPPRNPPTRQMQRDAYTIPPSPYNIPSQSQPRPWQTEQRPSPSQPNVVYSAPPILDYPHAPQYSGGVAASHPTVHRTFSEWDRERPMPLREEYFPTDHFDEDYYRMPPPPPPKGSRAAPMQQRPAIRHAATTAARATHHERYMAENRIGEEQVLRSPRKHDDENYERSRRPSLASRPSNASSHDRPHAVNKLEKEFLRTSVEGSGAAAKQRRRMTYYGGHPSQDLERRAEAYQAQRTGNSDSTSIPLTADSLKLVRHKTQTSNSDAGSRASAEGRASRGSSDVKPRSATGRRGSSEVKTRNETDGFTMRFDPSHSVNVDLKGGAKGQTISLRQSREGDGNIELSIGAKPEIREKSRRRQSYVDGAGVRELEFVRSSSRMGRTSSKTDTERQKERSVAPSRSRRSSKSRGALME